MSATVGFIEQGLVSMRHNMKRLYGSAAWVKKELRMRLMPLMNFRKIKNKMLYFFGNECL
ncbi:hypothetical protein DRW42_14815 [Pedobacter miscanthi]|uniref:Uncharacterized protein n=1 Tax=Pedobacter miscanthi TaxID=2259170 RepID=A0A366KY06_9SPHI|nr:hypothetical protein DRW42_14815 [Pedobacter miscanthi]